MTQLTTDEAFRMQRRMGVPVTIAYGMGVDSTAVLVGLHRLGLRPDKITFADTGSEKPETYAYREVIEPWLKRVGFPALDIVARAPTSNARGTYNTLEDNCLVNQTLPSIAFGRKGCSVKWKREPQDQDMNAWQPAIDAWARGQRVVKAIGYDCGPGDARRKSVPDDDKYQYIYPLRDWRWDRMKCIRQIQIAGLEPPPKSACFFCPVSKTYEIDDLAARHPDLVRRTILMELVAAKHMRNMHGLWRRPVKGTRGAEARPGSITAYVVGTELLPEFEDSNLITPWWMYAADRRPADAYADHLSDHDTVLNILELLDMQ